MAGFKHRYLVLKVNSDYKVALGVKNVIYKSMKTNFGDFVLSLVDTFEVVESYEKLGLLILRCNLSIYKYLCYTIISMGKVSNSNIRVSIVNVSGILKKAKKKLILDFNKESKGVV